MTDFTKRGDLEAKALELLDADTLTARGMEWSPERQLVAMTFRAMWTASLSVEQIDRIGSALASLELNEKKRDWSPILRAYVRAKVLRSHVVRGVRRYEVNI